jgi:hypothetical protein
MKAIVFFILIFHIILFSKESKIIESQPEILFEYKKLNRQQNKIALQVKFNNAVLYLEQEKYISAIRLFKQTQKILKIPSFLNIGIAYYKLKSLNNAYLYLNKIYQMKEIATQDPYSYMSATYYLFKLTNNKKYIDEIIKISKKLEKFSEPIKRLVVNVYIKLKQYKNGLKILKTMDEKLFLKIALVQIKLKLYEQAIISLDKALKISTNDTLTNKILWIKTFTDLKANNFKKLEDDIAKIQHRRRIFKTHLTMPLKLYFNKNKYLAKDYFNSIVKFNINRKIDFIFYFAPYIFVDNDAIQVDGGMAFLLKNDLNVKKLDKMVGFNKYFINIIKKDPIEKTTLLQKYIDKRYLVQDYEYYNLALSYAQIDNFHKAYKYFYRAYNLNRSNKLYAAMTLLSAKRVNIRMNEVVKEKIIKNLLSKDGLYNYFSKFIYRIIFDNKLIPKKQTLSYKYKKSIFYRALYFLDHVNETGIEETEPLLIEYYKDPLIYMFSLIARQKNESDYQYIARIQDKIPLEYNNIFVKGPVIITRYYIDILKAMGILHIANLNIDKDISATYYRTKALVQLYNEKPKAAIEIIEYLQKQYILDDKYTNLLLIASLIKDKRVEDATLSLTLMQRRFKTDEDFNFLIGLELIRSLKLSNALPYFQRKYNNDLIDFKLFNLDKLLEDI